MRKRLALLAIVCLSCSAFASISITANTCANNNGGSGTTVSCTINNTGAGDLNVFLVGFTSSVAASVDTSGSVVSVSDGNGAATCIPGSRLDMNSGGGTYNFASEVCYFNGIAANGSNVVTATVSNGYGTTWHASITASEWTGQASSGLIVETATNHNTYGTPTSGPTTVTAATPPATATFSYTGPAAYYWEEGLIVFLAADSSMWVYSTLEIYGNSASAGTGYTSTYGCSCAGPPVAEFALASVPSRLVRHRSQVY